MTQHTPANLRPGARAETLAGSVIHGTNRPQDLIPAFLRALEQVAPAAHQQLTFGAFSFIPAYVQDEGDNSSWWQSDECADKLSQLFDALDEHAPEGFTFGAHPGDGSDFGYWPVESDDDTPPTNSTPPTGAPVINKDSGVYTVRYDLEQGSDVMGTRLQDGRWALAFYHPQAPSRFCATLTTMNDPPTLVDMAGALLQTAQAFFLRIEHRLNGDLLANPLLPSLYMYEDDGETAQCVRCAADVLDWRDDQILPEAFTERRAAYFDLQDHDIYDVQALAREFCRVVRKDLDPAELAQVLDLNANEDNPDVCHTHDARDANMLMLDAWTRTFGRDPAMLDESPTQEHADRVERESDIWGQAWTLAKLAEFDPDRVLTHNGQQAHAHLFAEAARLIQAMPDFAAQDAEIRTSVISEARRLTAEHVQTYAKPDATNTLDIDRLYFDALEGALNSNSTHALTLELHRWEHAHGLAPECAEERLAEGDLCTIDREYLLAFCKRWERAEGRERSNG